MVRPRKAASGRRVGRGAAADGGTPGSRERPRGASRAGGGTAPVLSAFLGSPGGCSRSGTVRETASDTAIPPRSGGSVRGMTRLPPAGRGACRSDRCQGHALSEVVIEGYSAVGVVATRQLQAPLRYRSASVLVVQTQASHGGRALSSKSTATLVSRTKDEAALGFGRSQRPRNGEAGSLIVEVRSVNRHPLGSPLRIRMARNTPRADQGQAAHHIPRSDKLLHASRQDFERGLAHRKYRHAQSRCESPEGPTSPILLYGSERCQQLWTRCLELSRQVIVTQEAIEG